MLQVRAFQLEMKFGKKGFSERKKTENYVQKDFTLTRDLAGGGAGDNFPTHFLWKKIDSANHITTNNKEFHGIIVMEYVL